MTIINQKTTNLKWWRGALNGTSFIVLSMLSVANGLTNNFIAWSADAGPFPLTPIILLALFSIVVVHTSEKTTPHSLFVPIAILVICVLVPSSLFSWVGILFAALAYRKQTGSFNGEVMLLVMLALSFLWRDSLFKITSGFILNAETWLIGVTLSPFFPELSVYKNHLLLSEAHNLSIGVGCSVFCNLSLVILGWMSIYYLLGYRKMNVLWFVCILAVLIVTNIVRIGLMSIDYQTYVLVHEGVGATVYNTFLILVSASPLILSFFNIKGDV